MNGSINEYIQYESICICLSYGLLARESIHYDAPNQRDQDVKLSINTIFAISAWLVMEQNYSIDRKLLSSVPLMLCMCECTPCVV